MVNLLAALLVLAQAPAQNPAAEAQAAFDTLKRAETFILGPVGLIMPPFNRPRILGPGEKALLVILKEKDARSRFEALMKEASPAGKAYALLGLRHVDRKLYEARLKELKTDDSRVTSMGGCIIYRKALSHFALEIDRGRYDRWVTPAVQTPASDPAAPKRQ